MAVTSRLDYVDGKIVLSLYADESREWIAQDPDDRNWGLYIYADLNKLDRGSYEIVGIEALDVSDLTETWLTELERLDLPTIDIDPAGLHNVSVADALRWAHEHYPSRFAQASR